MEVVTKGKFPKILPLTEMYRALCRCGTEKEARNQGYQEFYKDDEKKQISNDVFLSLLQIDGDKENGSRHRTFTAIDSLVMMAVDRLLCDENGELIDCDTNKVILDIANIAYQITAQELAMPRGNVSATRNELLMMICNSIDRMRMTSIVLTSVPSSEGMDKEALLKEHKKYKLSIIQGNIELKATNAQIDQVEDYLLPMSKEVKFSLNSIDLIKYKVLGTPLILKIAKRNKQIGLIPFNAIAEVTKKMKYIKVIPLLVCYYLAMRVVCLCNKNSGIKEKFISFEPMYNFIDRNYIPRKIDGKIKFVLGYFASFDNAVSVRHKKSEIRKFAVDDVATWIEKGVVFGKNSCITGYEVRKEYDPKIKAVAVKGIQLHFDEKTEAMIKSRKQKGKKNYV